MEFTALEQWEKECGLFQQVMKIPFFNRYQSWKAHYTWKKTIKTEKMAESSKVLSQNPCRTPSLTPLPSPRLTPTPTPTPNPKPNPKQVLSQNLFLRNAT